MSALPGVTSNDNVGDSNCDIYDLDNGKEDEPFVGLKEDGEPNDGLNDINHVCDLEIRHFMASPSLDVYKERNAGIAIYNHLLKWWKQNEGLYPI